MESSMESSFQFYFQALFSLPTLVIAYLDIHEGKLSMQQLINWKNVSIVLSFMSFAYTSFNIRWVYKKSVWKIVSLNFARLVIADSYENSKSCWLAPQSKCQTRGAIRYESGPNPAAMINFKILLAGWAISCKERQRLARVMLECTRAHGKLDHCNSMFFSGQ